MKDSSDGNLAGRDASIWLGTWEIPDRGSFNGQLHIREVSSNSFLFDLEVNHGSHLGNISGTAQIASRDLAHFQKAVGTDVAPCELTFRRHVQAGRREIRIEEAGTCFAFHGMAAQFEGTYVRRVDPLFETGFLSELELQRVQELMGQHYSEVFRALWWGKAEHSEANEVRVFRGGMPGHQTITEAIVMVDTRGRMWIAFLEENIVRYFTTEKRGAKALPATFEKWRENFKEVRVEYSPDVNRIPWALGEDRIPGEPAADLP